MKFIIFLSLRKLEIKDIIYQVNGIDIEEIYYQGICKQLYEYRKSVSIYTDVNLWTITVCNYFREYVIIFYVCYVTDKEDSLWQMSNVNEPGRWNEFYLIHMYAYW